MEMMEHESELGSMLMVSRSIRAWRTMMTEEWTNGTQKSLLRI
jgi:hypothetical protein